MDQVRVTQLATRPNAARLERDLTQDEIAKAVKSEQATISRWFAGKGRPGRAKEALIIDFLNEAGRKLGLDDVTGDELWGEV